MVKNTPDRKRSRIDLVFGDKPRSPRFKVSEIAPSEEGWSTGLRGRRGREGYSKKRPMAHEQFLAMARLLVRYKKEVTELAEKLIREKNGNALSEKYEAFRSRFGEPDDLCVLHEWLRLKVESAELGSLFNFFSMPQALDLVHEMFHAHMGLAFSLAKYCVFNRIKSLALEDIIQFANIGLLEAIARFDPERGFRFSTYASWWIRQVIDRGYTNTGHCIRIPVHAFYQHRLLSILAQKEGLDLDRERAEAIERLAFLTAKKGSSVKRRKKCIAQVLEMVEKTQRFSSLDQISDGAGQRLIDTVADESILPADILLEARQFEDRIVNIARDMLAIGYPKGWKVITHRFGLDGESPKTLVEVALMFHLTHERIRQIEYRALKMIRAALKRSNV